jgi:phosphoglycolate phosphatase
VAAENDFKGLTVVFDLDGTLVDTAPDLIGALNHVMEGIGLAPVGRPDVNGLIGHGARAMLERGLALRGQFARIDQMDAYFEAFLQHYSEHIADGSRLFDGAAEAMATLIDRGARLAICTNKPQRLSESLLSALGILQNFSAVVGADRVDRRKPDPAHVQETLRQAGGWTSAVFVGDSRTDERAARHAGLPFVLFPYGYETETAEEMRPDAVLNHYSELVAIVETIRA